MEQKFVKISFDLYANWDDDDNPDYRVYVNDELFCDRTWIWGRDVYLNQILQVQADPGIYYITIDNLNKNTEFLTYNHKVEVGDGQWLDKNQFEIL